MAVLKEPYKGRAAGGHVKDGHQYVQLLLDHRHASSVEHVAAAVVGHQHHSKCEDSNHNVLLLSAVGSCGRQTFIGIP